MTKIPALNDRGNIILDPSNAQRGAVLQHHNDGFSRCVHRFNERFLSADQIEVVSIKIFPDLASGVSHDGDDRLRVPGFGDRCGLEIGASVVERTTLFVINIDGGPDDGFDAVQNRHVELGLASGISAEITLLHERPDNQDVLDPAGIERQQMVLVFQQYDRFLGSLESEAIVRRVVQHGRIIGSSEAFGSGKLSLGNQLRPDVVAPLVIRNCIIRCAMSFGYCSTRGR